MGRAPSFNLHLEVEQEEAEEILDMLEEEEEVEIERIDYPEETYGYINHTQMNWKFKYHHLHTNDYSEYIGNDGFGLCIAWIPRYETDINEEFFDRIRYLDRIGNKIQSKFNVNSRVYATSVTI